MLFNNNMLSQARDGKSVVRVPNMERKKIVGGALIISNIIFNIRSLN